MEFTDLPLDIVDTIIFFLPHEAIKSLSLTCKSLHNQINSSHYVWHLLYEKTFGTQPTPYSFSSWPELYKLRSQGKLFTWGSLVGGRLGYNSKEVPPEHLNRSGFNVGVGIPTEVPGLEGLKIADVSAGGFSFQLLTQKGEIYSLGNWHNGNNGPGPGRENPDYNPLRDMVSNTPSTPPNRTNFGVPPPADTNMRLGRLGGVRHFGEMLPLPAFRAGPRSRVNRVVDTPNTAPEPSNESEDKPPNRFLHRETTISQDEHKFISVSSGRVHFIALDDAGDIWSWDSPVTGCGVRLRFQEGDKDLAHEGHRVLKCMAGWGSSVAFLYGYGLVYWNKRDSVKQGESSASVFFNRIPNTGDVSGDDRVVDFVSCDNFVVYLTADGKLYRNDMIGEESIHLDKFEKYLKEHADSIGPKFTRLSGNFQRFACFSNEDIVLTGTKDSLEPIVIDELGGKQCISIAMGDYHFLALLKDGTLLSWGLESNSCGCLGLGKDPEVGIREGGSSIRVVKPTRVETQGKVLTIAAAGWQSCAIISK